MGWFRSRELSPLEGYRRWAGRYPPQAHNAVMQAEQSAMVSLFPDWSGKEVVDVGCGTGRYLALLEAAERRVGVDASPEMLAQVTEEVALVQADATHLPFPEGSFDGAVSGLTLGHVVDLDRALGELGRVLRPGGTLVYSTFHPYGAVAGWKRTFRGAWGRLYSVRYQAHMLEDHVRGLHAAGLVLEAVREPFASGPDGRRVPVALVIRARR